MLARFLPIPPACCKHPARSSCNPLCTVQTQFLSAQQHAAVVSEPYVGGSYSSAGPRYSTLCSASSVSFSETRTSSANPAPEVRAVLFDMDGVLCNSEDLSRRVAVQVLKRLYGLEVNTEEFIPFVGTGEANFLGGVARQHGAPFDEAEAKYLFFKIYLEEASRPGTNIGFPGAVDLVRACHQSGLRTAVASSADRIKVDANLLATGFDAERDFDVIISADKFELLKPAPDVFLAAAQALGIHPDHCVVVEDAPAGIQAARAAGMRCVGVATSLKEDQMLELAPDAVRRDISSIVLADLVTLQPRAGRNTIKPSADIAVQGSWLDEQVPLAGGYKISRRDLLKVLPLFGIGGAGYTLVQNAKAFSYVSPRALLKALFPGQGPPKTASPDTSDRVTAFRRYIAEKEQRGSLEEVPEFPTALTWFNSPPLRLKRELKGKVLIYDFWTFCCVNCMHVLPSLAALEARYAGQPVAVVGVHSAKFDNEKDNESIRNAILRYEIQHPCVNDGNMVLWRDLGISSWPTLAVISPTGKLIATLPGEGQEQTVDAFIQAALAYYRERGELDSSPLPLALERNKGARLATSPLRFPGKLAADLAGNRLFIADSNNNRIVITDLSGQYLDQLGGNGPRLEDGNFEEVAFSRPQGLAYSAVADALYIADTENHALRRVDFASRRVSTVAGNGSKGSDYAGGRRGRRQQLNSPWDLAFDAKEEVLYIAMAGQHQIWKHYVSTGVTANFSGDGSERNANGASARMTSWAQPSGLSLSADGQRLWVADSESSSIRSVSLSDGSSQGHVGGDPVFSDNLFQFGDKDGQGADARLQHPLAVCALADGSVLLADSYNHKLKVLDPQSNRIRSVAGTGHAGFADGAGRHGQLSEPGGLALGRNGSVFVADTNNSLIRNFDTSSGRLTTLVLQRVPPPPVSPESVQSSTPDEGIPAGATLVGVDPVQASEGELQIAISLPPGYHVTRGASCRFEATSTKPEAIALEPFAGALSATSMPSATIAFRTAGVAVKVRISTKVYFCQDEDVCLFEEVVFDVPFSDSPHGQQTVLLSYEVAARASPH